MDVSFTTPAAPQRRKLRMFKPASPPTPLNDWDSIQLIDDQDPADLVLLENSEVVARRHETRAALDMSRTLESISFSTPAAADTPRRAMSFATSTPGTLLRRRGYTPAPSTAFKGGARRLFEDDADRTFDEDGPSPIRGDDNEDSGTFLTPDRRIVSIGPSRQPAAVPFEIYEDNGDATSPVSLVASSSISVQRAFQSTAGSAADFALTIYSVGKNNTTGRNYITRRTETTGPTVEAASGVVESGRCRFSFRNNFLASNQDRENRAPGDDADAGPARAPGHVGIIEIDKSLFPRGLSTGRSDVLGMDPIFLTPANAHVTVLMPSQAAAFDSVEHFVIQVFSGGDWRTKLMSLAIHKAVFARLMVTDRISIPFHGIPVAPGEHVDMLMHVGRVRRGEGQINNAGVVLQPRLYVAIQAIDFSVPEGFERIRFAEHSSFRIESMGAEMVTALPAVVKEAETTRK